MSCKSLYKQPFIPYLVLININHLKNNMKNIYFLLLSLVFFGCSTTKTTMTGKLENLSDQAKTEATVKMNDIKAHIGYLASDEMRGRDTPSNELNIAAQYLANTLLRLGVKKAPGMDSYLQSVPMKKIKPASSGNFSFNDYSFEYGKEVLLINGENVEMDKEMVFVNRGSAEDLKGKDLKGKIAVAICGYEDADNPQQWFFDGRDKRSAIKETGAAGLIEIYNSSQLPFSFLANFMNRERTVVDAEDEEKGDFVHLWWNTATPEAIEAVKTGTGINGKVVVAGQSEEKVTTYNVVGVLEGSDPVLKDEYIIYSAHYDHVGVGRAVEGDSIYNGTRDNAIGTVTVISAAKNISTYPTKRSSLFIFFTGEEKGLLGSGYFADNSPIPLDKVTYCFNSDNAGYNDTSRVTIIGLERTLARPMIEKACTTFGLMAKQDENPEQNLFDRSDNVNFAAKGVPAPTFSLGIGAFDDAINKYYHQPQDNPDSVDYDYLYKFFRSYVYASRLIANTSESVFWVEGDKYYDIGKELYKKP